MTASATPATANLVAEGHRVPRRTWWGWLSTTPPRWRDAGASVWPHRPRRAAWSAVRRRVKQSAATAKVTHETPPTMLTGTVPAEEIRGIIAAAPDWAAELAAVENLEIVELNSGHWPQFSQPANLAEKIVAAVDR